MSQRKYRHLVEKGVLSPLDIHFAALMERLAGGEEPSLFLAAAMVSRATRQGHICLDLEEAAGRDLLEGGEEGEVFHLPGLDDWRKALRKSPVVGEPGEFSPLVLDKGERLYLFRYWEYQEDLAGVILGRVREEGEREIDPGRLGGVLDRLFPEAPPGETDLQRVAAVTALLKRFCVVTGGPGTGKTTTVSRILALLLEEAGEGALAVALAAPTGKGAARMEEAIRASRAGIDCGEEIRKGIPEEASTLHRLLGSLPGSPYFRHDARNPLSADVVVVDEASMVDLALMCKLVRALRPEARLILLGDRDQLASVEAGAVLGDICGRGRSRGVSSAFSGEFERLTGRAPTVEIHDQEGPEIRDSIVQLEKNYRFGSNSGIHALSRAVRDGNGEEALEILRGRPREDLIWHELPGSGGLPAAFREAVTDGFGDFCGSTGPEDALSRLDDFRILCALREGPFGTFEVNALAERVLQGAGLLKGVGKRWYEGRPVMVTRNDYTLKLFNGDTGVLLPDPSSGQDLRAFFPGPGGTLKKFHPLRLPEHETIFAMTVHKSQGSEFRRVLMVLPDRSSPLLTRELIYTGITRARERVEIWGRESVFREAVSRRIERRSGLREALWGA